MQKVKLNYFFMQFQEMIEDMEGVTKELLIQFYRSVKQKPCKIVMYRDGVSEGQFQQVCVIVF